MQQAFRVTACYLVIYVAVFFAHLSGSSRGHEKSSRRTFKEAMLMADSVWNSR